MKRTILFGFAFLLFTGVVNAVTVNVNCDKPGHFSKIGAALKMLNPQGPNTINISGTCKENLTIYQFDRLSLIAAPGAVIQDASGGKQDVIGIWDSRRILIQGFTITGGANGVNCGDGSFCTLTGNTIERSANTGLIVSLSQADLRANVVQDNGGAGLDLERSTIYADGLTIQQNRGSGIYSEAVTLDAFNLNVLDNQGTGIALIMQSNLFLGSSVVSHNGGDGIGVYGQGCAFVGQVTATENGGSAVAMQDLSLGDFYGGGTFTGSGSGTDIACWGPYAAARFIQNATYGSTNCEVPTAQSAAAKRGAPLLRPSRSPVR